MNQGLQDKEKYRELGCTGQREVQRTRVYRIKRSIMNQGSQDKEKYNELGFTGQREYRELGFIG